MTKEFMIKFAWVCNHANYGEILSFIVTPKVVTASTPAYTTHGYYLSKDLDEVIRFPSDNPRALSITKRLARVNSTQWSHPSYGDVIQEEFDLDDFFDEYHYQDNYGREVTFHTHKSCY